MLFNLLGFAVFERFATDEAKAAAEKAFVQFGVILLGVLLLILGVVFIVGASQAGQTVKSVVNLVATKGAGKVAK